mgnify:CR=1 FL=1
MTQHALQGRTESEVLWFQRRSFLQAAAAWTASGGFAAAHAQSRSNVVELRGDALVNGQRLVPGGTIASGDQIQTGPDSQLIFAIGNSAFLVRQNSQLTVERGSTINVVSVLRLVTGAVASVWGKGSSRQIITPTLTAGIRGTGVYTEVLNQHHVRSYFCNCYGTVQLVAGDQKTLSVSEYHQPFWANMEPDGTGAISPARPINHTDEELEFLAKLVNQRTAWQITGRKGQGHA